MAKKRAGTRLFKLWDIKHDPSSHIACWPSVLFCVRLLLRIDGACIVTIVFGTLDESLAV